MINNKPILLSDIAHLQSKAITFEQAAAKIDVRPNPGEGQTGNSYFIKPRKRVAV